MGDHVADRVRESIASSIQHLTRVCSGNEQFIKENEEEINRAASVESDHTRMAMTANMVQGLRTLVDGLKKVNDLLRTKLVTLQMVYVSLTKSSHVIEADARTAANLLAEIPENDDVWIALITELMAQGHTGTILEGLVLPFLRQSEIPAFKALCE